MGITDLFPAPVNIVWVNYWTEATPVSFAIKGFDGQSADLLIHQIPLLEQALTQHLQCWLITKDQRKAAV